MRKRGTSLREREVATRTLNSILDQSEFRDQVIGVLSIDVEGHELAVLRSIDFDRYQPRVVIIESHIRSLEELMDSEEFKLLTANGYNMFNWTGPSVLFLRKETEK